MEPLISIIIACYNAEDYIDQCLSSLVCQSYQNIEIIICDDCSTDDSYSVLTMWAKRDNRIKVLKNDVNSFAAYTRNKCIEHSHGEYIMIQDIDDYSHPERVEILLKAFKNNPTVSIISSPMATFNKDPNILTFPKKNKIKRPSKYSFLQGMPFSHPASMITRDCIVDVGGYRVAKDTKRCQDYDMFMRMYAKGYKGLCIDIPLYYYRLDDDNYKRRTFKARVGEYRIRLLGFKQLGMMPWAYLFTLRPFIAHAFQFCKNILRVS